MAQHAKTPSVTLSVTTTSARVALPQGTSPTSSSNGVCVKYVGTGLAYLVSGDSTVTATLTNQPIIPNWPTVFMVSTNDTHIACIADAGGSGKLAIAPCSADEQV